MDRVPDNTGVGQTDTSARKNAQFFLEEHADYKNKIDSIDTYHSISEVINREIGGVDRLLDIGNGGVFDYETSLVKEIVGLDLFLDSLPANLKLAPNITMVQGSALSIPPTLKQFDAVLMVMLIHHLVGKSVSICRNNVRLSFVEAYRTLNDGGRLLVMDSCVPSWFFWFESLIFRLASWVIEKTIKHPPVLQYTGDEVEQMMKSAGFSRVSRIVVPKGRFILQFGVKVPAFLTPTQPMLFVGHKD